MFSVQLSSFLCLITLLGSSTAFWFRTKEPVDCQVSFWSKWTEPYGFGEISRERKILRYAANGGAACPTELKQVNSTGQLPSTKATAEAIVNHFFLRPLSTMPVKTGLLRDLLLIMDSSGSVPSSSFSTAKSEMGELVELLCPTSDPFQTGYQHAAMLEYSTKVNVVFDFNDYVNTAQVKQGILSAVYQGDGTCTATAFRKAQQMFSVNHGMRTDPNVKKEVLILSDGMSNCGGNARLAAIDLAQTAEVFALIIGGQSSSGKAEITSYVSGPSHQHLFVIGSFNDLHTLLDEIKSFLKLTTNPCASFNPGKK